MNTWADLASWHLAWPWALLALPMPWLLVKARPWAPGGGALRAPWAVHLQSVAAWRARASRPRLDWRAALALLAWGLLCLAVARPQQVGAPVQPPEQARELMLAVDLSGSMAEHDMWLGGRGVDRLTAAKAVIADFLQRRQGDRIGLLVFGTRAYVLAPPTRDRDSVRGQLADTQVGLAGRETAIGDAIGLGVRRLRADARAQAGGQTPGVLILLTDGASNAGRLTPLEAAALARALQVRVHAIAFGAEAAAPGLAGLFGQPSPVGDTMDTDTLAQVAALTGGQLFRAADTAALARIYAHIDQIEPVARPGLAVRPMVERYPWPLAAALVCALALVMLPRRGAARPVGPGAVRHE